MILKKITFEFGFIMIIYYAKLSYSKLVKRGYKHNLLLKYFKKFCAAYNIEGKYGEKNSDLLF